MKFKKFITLPNIITLLRLPIALILTIYLEYFSNIYFIALSLALIALTDIADGYIARKLNMVSEVGKALDPVVDKCVQIFIVIGLIKIYPSLYIYGMLYIFIQMIVMVFGTIAIVSNIKVVESDLVGKITTCIFYVGVFLLSMQFLSYKFIIGIIIIMLFITVFSSIHYLCRK